MPLFNTGGIMGEGLPSPNTQFNNPNGITNAYKSALATNAGDYDRISKGYNDLLSAPKPQSLSYVPINPVLRQYSNSAETDSVANELSAFAQNGGYSDADVNALRARGTAPIRSAYATALKELNRAKSLSGGQLANPAVALAKFAREKGYLLSDQATNINAGIAERVAQNKLSALSALGPLASAKVSQRNSVDQYNTDLINEINKFNVSEQDKINQMNQAAYEDYLNNQNQALAGMSSIYSASPGLVNTFGNQVLADRNQVLSNNAQRASQGLSMISQLNRPSQSYVARG